MRVVLRGNPFLSGIYRRTSCHVACAPRNDDYKYILLATAKTRQMNFRKKGAVQAEG